MPPQGLGTTDDARPMGAQARPGPDAAGPGLDPEEGALGPEGGVEQASPDEQELYNRFVGLFMLALYDEKLMPRTVEFLRSAPDPVAAVAEVASLLSMRVFTHAKDAGITIPGSVLLHAGKDEVVPLVIELAEEAGVAEFDPAMAEAAFYQAAEMFSKGARKMGAYSEEIAQSDLSTLNKMADSGQLEPMVRQMTAAQQGGEAA